MNTNKYTIAVIGCGRISNNAHFPALSGMDNVRIKYACDLIPEKAEDKVARFGAEQAITDYKTALDDPEVEAVWVLTPNYAHYTVTMDALKAGKHVFCEKPITVNYDLSCKMAEEAKKQGKLLNIGVCNRYHKTVEMLEEMNRRGDFGRIYHVYCSFRSHRSIPGLGGAFTDKSQSGGGVLIDWGIHFLDLILYILGGATLKTVTCDAYSEMAKDMKSYVYRGMWAEETKNTVAVLVNAKTQLTGGSFYLSSYGNNTGTVTFDVYRWDTDYKTTLKGRKLATDSAVDFTDNTIFNAAFDGLDTGYYLIVINGTSPADDYGVAVWTRGPVPSSITFVNGERVDAGLRGQFITK